MKAPSENHIEDWLVENAIDFKREPNHWETFGAQNQFHYVDKFCLRQFRLSCGVVDLIGVKDDQIVVVELKKNRPNEKTIIQLMKYMGEIRSMLDFRELKTVKNIFNKSFVRLSNKVIGLAVGYGCPSQQTSYGCPHDINIVSYDYNNGSYSFKNAKDHLQPQWIDDRSNLSISNKITPLLDHVIELAHSNTLGETS